MNDVLLTDIIWLIYHPGDRLNNIFHMYGCDNSTIAYLSRQSMIRYFRYILVRRLCIARPHDIVRIDKDQRQTAFLV